MALQKKVNERLNDMPEYRAYTDAKQRCNNPNCRIYKYYGGRGIEFKFKSFDEFISILGRRPEGHSLDRIDVNGDYTPDNVRWADWSTQMNNRRPHETPWLKGNTHNVKSYVITHPDGSTEEITNMAKFCRKHGLDKANLHATLPDGRAKTHKGFKANYKEVA